MIDNRDKKRKKICDNYTYNYYVGNSYSTGWVNAAGLLSGPISSTQSLWYLLIGGY